MIIKGKNLRLKFGTKTLYHATECGLSIASKTDEIASKDTEGDEVVFSGYNYSLSTSALYATLPTGDTTHITMDDLIDSQLDGGSITWAFSSGEPGSRIYSGTVIITQSDINAAAEGNASGSFSLTGSGDITRTTVPD